MQNTWDCKLTQCHDDPVKSNLLDCLCRHKPLCLGSLRISLLTSLNVVYCFPFPDGQIHWSQTSSKPRPSTSPWSQPLSVDVELTAYVLLALLSKPNVTGSDLTTASGIVAWLTRQQNAYGGFASTQVICGLGRGCCLIKNLCTVYAQYLQVQML